jgi:hypothetical protein
MYTTGMKVSNKSQLSRKCQAEQRQHTGDFGGKRQSRPWDDCA